MHVIAITEQNWQDLRLIRLLSLKASPQAFVVTYQQATHYSDDDWKKRAAGQHDQQFFIGYSNKQACALIAGIVIKNEYQLISLWLQPELRGTGASQLLIQAVQSHAVSIGHHQITLNVSENNIAACRLYQKCKFKIIANITTLINNNNVRLLKMMWRANND